MPLAITPINYLKISGCESATDGGTWTANAIAAVGDFKREGTNCLGATIRAQYANDINLAGSFNLDGVKHLRAWIMFTNISNLGVDAPATPANAGIQLYIGDASVTAYYNVSGKTTYPGGFYPLVVDLSRTPDSGTKPSNMAACTKIGIRIYLDIAVAKNVQNCWWDFLIYCDGLQCSGTPQYSLDTIWALDDATTGAWGIIRKIGGVYYLLGSLDITTDFKDTSQVVVFEDRKVNAALYELKVTTVNGVFQLGDKAGSAGVSGCMIRTQTTAQTPKFKITCTDVNVVIFKLYGSTFFDAGVISLPLTGTNREVLNCNFEKCDEVLASTCKFENCNIISADNRGVRIDSAGTGVKDCKFINCPHSVHCPVSIAVPFTNLQFIGTNGADKWDIEHSVAGTLTVNWTGYQPQYVDETGGGGTVFYNYVDLTIYVKDEAQGNINGATVRVSKYDDNAVVYMNEATGSPNPDGVAYESINNPGTVNLRVRVRKSSSGTRYIPVETTGQMTATGFALTVILYIDGNL